jgi:hypothetical protein
MLKLRVIKGGKHRSPSAPKMRLFSAYSVVDNFQGHDCVKLNWIFLDRKFPVAGFDKLIDCYGQIDERMRSYFEEYVKELFTEDEIEALGRYVKDNLRVDVQAAEEPMPISCVFVPMPYKEIKPGGSRGFYHLSPGERDELPFKACAYYDLSKSPPSVFIESEARERGVAFLKESLQSLGLEIELEDGVLRSIVEKVYDGSGLIVEKGKTKDDRLKARSEYFKVDANPPKN